MAPPTTNDRIARLREILRLLVATPPVGWDAEIFGVHGSLYEFGEAEITEAMKLAQSGVAMAEAHLLDRTPIQCGSCESMAEEIKESENRRNAYTKAVDDYIHLRDWRES